ncbi:protein TIFY 10c-like isoform X2 [Panicum virgatum]|uniref:protein TIFY 10c-like isoform X2 n=1 Tax=Panicum virgatum TaxID=38727 RepID=UPI0019D52701|nr:protein TIFY 10c-like isoform X2 [Panicum virgatum]
MAAEKQEERAAAAMVGRAPAREKSSFAVTCGLLSQYLKDKKGGGLQGLGGLGMAPPPPAAAAFRPPTTMNLLSALDAPAAEGPNDAAKATPPEEAEGHDQKTAENPREAAAAAAGEDEPQQLTIFYGGKVVLFDKFPPAKVKDLLQIVDAGGDRAGATVAPQASRSSLSVLLLPLSDQASAAGPPPPAACCCWVQGAPRQAPPLGAPRCRRCWPPQPARPPALAALPPALRPCPCPRSLRARLQPLWRCPCQCRPSLPRAHATAGRRWGRGLLGLPANGQ